eukprot:SAG11_NODE_1063_length_5996_cov_2.201798_6_plen_72_part_00
MRTQRAEAVESSSFFNAPFVRVEWTRAIPPCGETRCQMSSKSSGHRGSVVMPSSQAFETRKDGECEFNDEQ